MKFIWALDYTKDVGNFVWFSWYDANFYRNDEVIARMLEWIYTMEKQDET